MEQYNSVSMSNFEKTFRVGSRKSELALIQTNHVIACLQKKFAQAQFEIHTMTTMGDRVLNIALPKIGEKSLFTKDLEEALENGRVDFVVHSLKDLPTVLPTGMVIGAVLEREDPRDALVLNEEHKGKSLSTLPEGSIIGTSSLRRTAQLKRMYPHLQVCDIRGNLNTRLAKLDADSSIFAGLILAQAGLVRIGWKQRISQILEPVELLYAVGQGALAVECRSNDMDTLAMLQSLVCLPTTCRILTERSFLKTLGGGCSAPVAVCSELKALNVDEKFALEIEGAVWSLDGKNELKENVECSLVLQKRKIEFEDGPAFPAKRTKNKKQNLNPSTNEPVRFAEQQSPLESCDDGEKSMQHLLDIHQDLFKRCPFFSQHKQDIENKNITFEHSCECPLSIPVGQDFMGKCPYFETDRSSKLSTPSNKASMGAASICPASHSTVADNPICKSDASKTSVGSVDHIKNNPHSSVILKECPFFRKSDVSSTEADKKTCLPDVNAERDDVTACDDDQPFCGLFRHKLHSAIVYKQCYELGKKLAENLIKKGALDIMKIAQHEVRQK